MSAIWREPLSRGDGQAAATVATTGKSAAFLSVEDEIAFTVINGLKQLEFAGGDKATGAAIRAANDNVMMTSREVVQYAA